MAYIQAEESDDTDTEMEPVSHADGTLELEAALMLKSIAKLHH